MPVAACRLCHGRIKAVAEAYGWPIKFSVIFLFINAKYFTESRLLNSAYLKEL